MTDFVKKKNLIIFILFYFILGKAETDSQIIFKDYIFNSDLNKCYKFHAAPKTWTDAVKVCAAEQSYLAIPNSQDEADILMELMKDVPEGIESLGVVHLGFQMKPSGWMTLDDGQQSKKFFRKDYTYLSPSEGFYKIHTIHRTWAEAKKRCALEGASLFYPENEKEANTVLGFWNQTQPFYWVYIGISDLLAKGVFETIDGRPVLDVYSKWGAGEPNDAGGVEDCVILRRDGTLNDDSCDKKLPFICKKALDDLEWDTDCDMPRTGYTYNADLGRCYKFHTHPKNWTDAISTCSAELSYLAVINSQDEADYLMQLTEKTNKDNAPGITMYGAVFLGFHNRYGDGWTTIKGTSIQDSGYAKWSPNQPDGGENEKCGTMFYHGQLNDLACDQRCFFICEHDISSLNQAIDERFNDLL